MSGTSKKFDHSCLIHCMWKRLLELDVHAWIERVPTDDNIADDPSRLVLSILKVPACFTFTLFEGGVLTVAPHECETGRGDVRRGVCRPAGVGICIHSAQERVIWDADTTLLFHVG